MSLIDKGNTFSKNLSFTLSIFISKTVTPTTLELFMMLYDSNRHLETINSYFQNSYKTQHGFHENSQNNAPMTVSLYQL